MSRVAARASLPPARRARTGRERPFFFMASKSGGGMSVGVRNAPSDRALAAGLRSERMVLTRAIALPAWLASPAKLGAGDQAALNEQLGQLLTRGVPLVESLEVASSVVSARARPAVMRVRQDVSGGSSFADACKRHGLADTVTSAIYHAAERTGDLDRATGEIARSIRRELTIRSRAQTVLIYPSVLMTIALLAGLLMLMVIIPMIGTSLKEADLSLPWYTEAMVDAGTAMRDVWYLVLLGIGGLGAGAMMARGLIVKIVTGTLTLLPPVKALLRTAESARFFTVMAAMTRSGLPLADALAVATRTIGDRRLRRDLDNVRNGLIRGGVLRNLLDKMVTLPLAVRKLLIAADRAGDLETAFSSLADDLTEKLDHRTRSLLALLEPAIIVLVFIPIGGMILSIMVPLLNLSSQVLE